MCKRKSDIESSGEKECIQPMETIKEGTTMHYESPGGSLWIWDSRLKKEILSSLYLFSYQIINMKTI